MTRRPRLTIVDYGMANLRSVVNKCRLVADVEVADHPDGVLKAERLVLPGVGHFKAGMEQLHSRRLIDALESRVIGDRIPFLGICLGMQLLSRHSEEGDVLGLGWIPATTVRLHPSGRCRVPHMGWNTLNVAGTSQLFRETDPADPFYFVHSFHVVPDTGGVATATTHYGVTITAAVQWGNIAGTQFHPEKSHDQGVRILQSFVES